MKLTLLNMLILIPLSIASANDKKLKDNDQQIVEKYIPQEFFQLQYEGAYPDDPHKGVFLTKDSVRISYVPIRFKNNKSKYIAAAYWVTESAFGDSEVFCKVRLIKIDKNEDSLMPEIKLKPRNKLSGSCEISLIDLDDDNTNEVVVTMAGNRYIFGSIYFKLGTEELIDVTPINPDPTSAGGSEFSNLLISDIKIDGRPLLVEKVARDMDPPRYLTKVYIFDNQFNKIGSYAEYFLIRKTQLDSKLSSKSVYQENYPIYSEGLIEFDWPQDEPTGVLPKVSGVYELEIKNLSEHKHGVRADLIVNGVQAISPIEFCEPKSEKNHKKDKDHDNGDDNDEHDNNRDGLKHCKIRDSVKVDVNMKAGKNVLKLKMLGKKDAVIQLTLNRKK